MKFRFPRWLKIILIVPLLLWAAWTAYDTYHAWTHSGDVEPNLAGDIPGDELPDVLRDARSGDMDSIVRLADYYSMLHYASISSRNPAPQTAFSNTQLGRQARYWALKAIDHGSEFYMEVFYHQYRERALDEHYSIGQRKEYALGALSYRLLYDPCKDLRRDICAIVREEDRQILDVLRQ